MFVGEDAGDDASDLFGSEFDVVSWVGRGRGCHALWSLV